MGWGIIFCADELIQSEMWLKVAEDLKDKGSWPEVRPWDLVMKITTYGGAESTYAIQHWWSLHVLFPCQSARPLASLQELEGTSLLPMPGGMSSSSTLPADHSAASQPQHNRGKPNKSKNLHSTAAHNPYPPAPHHGNGKGKGGKGKGHDGKGKKGGKAPTK